jgi:hypothetical protein
VNFVIVVLGFWLWHQVRAASPPRMYCRARPPKALVRLV